MSEPSHKPSNDSISLNSLCCEKTYSQLHHLLQSHLRLYCDPFCNGGFTSPRPTLHHSRRRLRFLRRIHRTTPRRIQSYRQRTRFAGRCGHVRRGAGFHGLHSSRQYLVQCRRTVPDGTLFPVRGIPHRGIFGTTTRQIQSRCATEPLFYRTPHTGQRPLLGFALRFTHLYAELACSVSGAFGGAPTHPPLVLDHGERSSHVCA